MKTMKDFLRKWRKYFVYAGFISCFINLLQLTFSFYMFAIYDAIFSSYDHDSLYSITVIAVFALFFLLFFGFLRKRILRMVGVDLVASFSPHIFRHTLLGYAGPSKQAYQQGMSDISTLNAFLNSDSLPAIFDIPWTPFYVLIIFLFHPMLGVVTLGVGLAILLLIFLQDRYTRDRLVKANSLAQGNKRFLDSMLANAEVVNAMGMGRSVHDRFDARNTEIVVHQTMASRYAGLTQSSIKSIQILMNVLLYAVGSWLAITENFNAGLIIVVSVIEGQALSPFMRVLFGAKTIVQAREAYKRLHGFFYLLSKVPPKMSLPAPRGALVADRVTFALGGRLLLREVSFDLEPGEFMGLVGPNGAGKTTLLRVLLGLWPSIFGAARLDGVSLQLWDKTELGPHIGYLPQEVELFPVSVAANIARLGEVDMDEVTRVCRIVGIESMIEALPQGYETMVGGTDGVRFSGGQKQRIGLARALYGAPRLLLLDEPNSNLDEAGEERLIDALTRIKADQGTTCVMITHKFSLLGVVDKVLMLQNGQVAYWGPRDEVLAAISRPVNPPAGIGGAGLAAVSA
ncbi:MAG: type I secretion system permease/ATPase [Deltaproteobacteria bacterium]|nr:type I secretion system permease/ATPase [Deltaproteobacteria bacterium]